MKKAIISIIVLLILLMGGFMGYMYLTQPVMEPVPPIPPAASSSLSTPDSAPKAASAVDPKKVNRLTDVAATSRDTMVIQIGGSETGTIKIELLNDVAPKHVARIEALARAGAYDNIVFHRVIGGFMAQTGDVKYGKRGDALVRAGMGGSSRPDLMAEFSNIAFKKGIVGMARGSSPNSANSQFFIMFADAPGLNGQYTVVGHVVAGQDIVDALKKGDPAKNGAVSDPDYMKKVTILAGS